MACKSIILLLSLFVCSCSSEDAGLNINSVFQTPLPDADPLERLPEGDNGIAVRYPGDVGIESDNDVIFSDGFEHFSIAELTNKWDEAYHAPNLRLTSGNDHLYTGNKGLEFKVPQGSVEANATVVCILNPKQDIIFARYYGKFDRLFNVEGSYHNGLSVTASYWDGPGSGPGIKADGFNKYLVNYETTFLGSSSAGTPGDLGIYIYHPEQRHKWGDYFFPSGRVVPFDQEPGNFGKEFKPRADQVPELGRWYCYEMMVKANTPGNRNGRVALWLDGVLIADFTNLRLRDTAGLKIDRVALDFYIADNSRAEAVKWLDNVVIATSYIGPIFSESPD